ncbi:MAG TPA: nitrate reductase molybdenum cofactor assembly chaperone [Flexivirga sp.]|uniref:nitrate reductase molybdenum cofactor assembly chaperone n=1 Tax=Flexivirga sp. TaxID=1962927 RepID=UPI002BC6ACE7|nr:nitrate reductase molybdenum cofactor assembly chaperone [Flexivirga sp.]HWC24259.1 nitrate reductase molybdenum cofactor assembly chaperone [Flexivirga sp.]
MKSLRWSRHRRTRAQLPDDVLAAAWQSVSLLLEYPDDGAPQRFSTVCEVAQQLPPEIGGPLLGFLDDASAIPLADLQADYVDTFDVTRKCSLHLTYFSSGDTRRRGVELVEFKQAYRHAGVELADDSSELPDFLPVLLEFGAFTSREAAWKLLNHYRVGVELLHRALVRRESRWLPVLDALRATLPSLGEDDEIALAELIAAGPPSEDVGIEIGIDNSPYSLDPRLNPRPAPVDLGMPKTGVS